MPLYESKQDEAAAVTRPWLTLANLAWLVLYLLTMAAVIMALMAARKQALANFDSPEALAQWEEFRADMRKIADDPQAPIHRRVPASDEPPTLRLLRDHFGACVGLAVLLSSALFLTLMVMIRGVFATESFTPRSDD